MADFMTDLWSAVFEAGPTPTLLLATNATFAALQAVLLALLVATYSIHFVILSVLCSGLWYSINWFATELKAVQDKEETAKRQGTQHDSEVVQGTGIAAEATSDSKATLSDRRDKQSSQPAILDGVPSTSASGARVADENDMRRRITQDVPDHSGDISTDSEWEQIDGER